MFLSLGLELLVMRFRRSMAPAPRRGSARDGRGEHRESRRGTHTPTNRRPAGSLSDGVSYLDTTAVDDTRMSFSQQAAAR